MKTIRLFAIASILALIGGCNGPTVPPDQPTRSVPNTDFSFSVTLPDGTSITCTGDAPPTWREVFMEIGRSLAGRAADADAPTLDTVVQNDPFAVLLETLRICAGLDSSGANGEDDE